MKTNSTSSLGALHPILFFMVVYGISLFLALFVCRTIYFGINEDASAKKEATELQASNLSAAVAYK
jgi:flagellar biosynthesis protein FliP